MPHELPDLRKLEYIRKVSKPHRMTAQCPAPPAKTNAWPIPAENPRKTEMKPPPQCAIPHGNQSQPQTPREPPQPPPQRHASQTPEATHQCTRGKAPRTPHACATASARTSPEGLSDPPE